MDDARPRQMEIIEMIFSNHNIMVYIFVQGFIWNILICQLSALRVCCDFSLDMINPPRPALTPHVIICTG